MPVKKRVTTKTSSSASAPKRKPATKKTATKKKVSKITRQERGAIKKAVSSLPGFIRESTEKNSWIPPVETRKPVGTSAPAKKESPSFFGTTEKKKVHPQSYFDSHFEKKKRKILWFGVGSIMLCVLFMWIYNIKVQVSQAKFSLGTEEVLWNSAKEDFNTLVKQPPIIQKPKVSVSEEETEKIKQVLAENVAAVILASTTSTSSTVETASTTLETVTSTKKSSLE